MQQRVEANLRGPCGLAQGGRVLVAVSGGVDSMVLLYTLKSLAPVLNLTLQVAHFNHQLRGRSSEADEKLVRRTAEGLGLPATVERGNVKAFAQKSGFSVEMAARKLRHEFLAKTARAAGCETIAVAHHADDQVELFFLRLLRGAGGEGLAGMKWRGPSPMDSGLAIIRPLLSEAKADLEVFAQKERIKYRTDATNASLAVPRNRVRHELLPLLRRHYQPGLTRTILRTMEIAGAEAELVGQLAQEWLRDRAAGGLPPRSFAELPVALQRRILQSQLPGLGRAMDYDLVEQLRAAAEVPVSTGLDMLATRDADGVVVLSKKPEELSFQAQEGAISLAGEAGEAEFGGVTIAWEFQRGARVGDVRRSQPGREVFDAARIGPAVVLRHWRAGDRFQPLGMKAPVKLQDLFTNAKIPRENRRRLLVATAGGEIFWVEGLRMAENFKVTSHTQRGLMWRWQRESIQTTQERPRAF